MSKTLPAAAILVSLLTSLAAPGTAVAAPDGSAALCRDPAAVAVIDRREAELIADPRMPGSGAALDSAEAPALARVRILRHHIEALGGHASADPDVAICRVRLHVAALTPDGERHAAEDLAYEISRSGDAITAAFCPYRQCPSEAATARPTSLAPAATKTAENDRKLR